MNMTSNETNATKTMPFPSQVTSPCENKDVQSLAADIIGTSRDMNNLLQSAGNVHFFVRNHYVDTANGIYGIESLIAFILKSNGAMYDSETKDITTNEIVTSTELKNYTNVKKNKKMLSENILRVRNDIIKNHSMFSDDVVAIVQNMFGVERYPVGTIRSFLSHFMSKKGTVGAIQLESAEDSPGTRPCPKPRCKFYFIRQDERVQVSLD